MKHHAMKRKRDMKGSSMHSQPQPQSVIALSLKAYTQTYIPQHRQGRRLGGSRAGLNTV
jgi:hypothetical protein